MANFRIKVDTSSAQRAIAQLQERATYAIARAINKTTATATTAMIRAISADTGVKQKDLRGTTKRNRAIWAEPAVAGREQATVYANVLRIPLIDFNARGPRPSRGKGKGVRAGLRGGAQRYPEAFIARMASGHEGVWARVDKGSGRVPRLPIRELHGPSIAHVWQKHSLTALGAVQEALPKNLAAEIRYELRRTGAPK